MSTVSFKPTLTLLDATMIVAGSMIGSGIFIVSADIARNVGSAGWLMIVWIITGFMTITAALSYGELSGIRKVYGLYLPGFQRRRCCSECWLPHHFTCAIAFHRHHHPAHFYQLERRKDG